MPDITLYNTKSITHFLARKTHTKTLLDTSRNLVISFIEFTFHSLHPLKKERFQKPLFTFLFKQIIHSSTQQQKNKLFKIDFYPQFFTLHSFKPKSLNQLCKSMILIISRKPFRARFDSSARLGRFWLA